jgi:hypothetical protein
MFFSGLRARPRRSWFAGPELGRTNRKLAKNLLECVNVDTATEGVGDRRDARLRREVVLRPEGLDLLGQCLATTEG